MVLSELGKSLTQSIRKFGARQSAQQTAEVDALLDEIGDALLNADVSVPYVQDLKQQIRNEVLDEQEIQKQCGVSGGFTNCGTQQKQRILQKAIVRHLAELLAGDRPGFTPKKGDTQVVLFVGLQGSGKTTTITKYAHYYKMKGFRVALVCADTFRAGAFDQLKQNASKIHCPFFGSYTETDPVAIAEEGVEKFQNGRDRYDLILVDSSGRHKQEQALFDEMDQLHTAIEPSAVILVMDSHIGQAGFRQAESFSNCVDIGSVILTKMDDSSGTKNKGGGALSAVAATGAPVIFLGTGEHFEDFEKFDAEGFVSKLLGLGDMKGLFNEISNNFLDMDELKNIQEGNPADPSKFFKGEHKNLFGNIMAGKFTLRNLYEMFSSMGPMGNLMNMLPGGMAGMLPPNMDKKQAQQRMRKLIVIMDSMTDQELDGLVDVKTNTSRRKRIQRGAGLRTDMELQHLFTEHTRIAEMVSKMGGMVDFNNPMAMMQNMRKMMTPDMKKQMKTMLGGMGGMGGMVEQMMESMGMGKMPAGMVDNMLGSFLNDDSSGTDPMSQMLNAAGGGPSPATPSASSSGGGGHQTVTPSTHPTSGFKHLILKQNTEVRIQGLKSRPAENGKVGKILAFDEAKQRYMVGSIPGVDQPLSLKPSNFVQTKAKVVLFSGASTSSGDGTGAGQSEPGASNATETTSSSSPSGPAAPISVPYDVVDMSSSAAARFADIEGPSNSPSPSPDSSTSSTLATSSDPAGARPESHLVESLQDAVFRVKRAAAPASSSSDATSTPDTTTATLDGKQCQLSKGQAVRVHGLQSEKGKVWNDSYGIVLGYDPEANRYAIHMGDAQPLKIKPANMSL